VKTKAGRHPKWLTEAALLRLVFECRDFAGKLSELYVVTGNKSFGAFFRRVVIRALRIMWSSSVMMCARYSTIDPLPRAGEGSCRLSSGIKTDYIDPVRSSANWKPPQIANLHRQSRPKLLHSHAGMRESRPQHYD
jgi:hypothetical protein